MMDIYNINNMKNLIIFLFSLIALTACVETVPNEYSDIPVSVYETVKARQKPEIYYTVTYEDYTYVFNKNKKLVNYYCIDKTYVQMNPIVFLFIVIILAGLLAIIFVFIIE